MNYTRMGFYSPLVYLILKHCLGSSLPHGPCEHVVGNLPPVMDERNITSDDPNKGASEITK